jgi:hypothetical protein
MLAAMEPNRHSAAQPDALHIDLMGECDSIVDRLLSVPVPRLDARDGVAIYETVVARRVEKLLVEQMRRRIETRV